MSIAIPVCVNSGTDPKNTRFFTRGTLCLLASLCLTGSLSAGIGSADMTTVLTNNGGDVHNRVNILFVSAGYAAGDMDTYHADVAAMTSAITNPEHGDTFLADYQNYFNIYRIEPVGATADDASGIVSMMDFDSAGNTTWLRIKSESYRNPLLGAVVVLKNTTTYEGGTKAGNPSPTPYITMSARTGNNSYSTSKEIFLHESGHAIAKLGDEYGYDSRLTPPPPGYGPNANYPGAADPAPNLTTDPNGTKWNRWMDPSKPVSDPNIAINPTEGGAYYNKGIYRSSPSSKMNVLGNPFDAVGREQYILSIYTKVRPLDSFRGSDKISSMTTELTWAGGTNYTGTSVEDILFNKAGIRLTDTVTLGTGEVMFVKPIDTGKIKVQWYLDGILKLEGIDEIEFNPLVYGAGIGETHAIEAWCWDQFAYDQDYVRLALNDAGNSMMQKVIWDSVIAIPEPSTYAFIIAAGSLAGVVAVRRRRK